MSKDTNHTKCDAVLLLAKKTIEELVSKLKAAEEKLSTADINIDSLILKKEALETKLKTVEEENRWIHVSERLPRDAHSILLYCNKTVTTGYFSDEWQIHGVSTPRSYYQHKITHWRPIVLPKIPQTEQKDNT